MIVELQQKRFSVREFTDEPVPGEVVAEMLEAARLSPSGGNAQDWSFGVVTDRTLIARIATAAYQQGWIAPAPLVVVLCTKGGTDAPGERRIQKQRFPHLADRIDAMDDDLYLALNLREHQTKIAGTAMTMTALERGVGSTWVSKFDVNAVAELIDPPDGFVPSEILVLGYPAGARTHAPRKPLGEVVFRRP